MQDENGKPVSGSQEILNQVRTQAGQPYSMALLDVDLKAVSALDRFITAESKVYPVPDAITGAMSGVRVVFVVRERSLISSVQLTGNRAFSDSLIREGLTVRPGSPNNSFAIDQDRKYILQTYHNRIRTGLRRC